MLSSALPAVEMARNSTKAGTKLSLEGLKGAMQLPTVTNAMQGAISMGVTSLSILGGMAIMHGGIMTLLGMPPNWMKKTILPS